MSDPRNDRQPTAFAPAERAPQSILAAQHALFKRDGSLQQLYNAVSDAILVLNCERQIVFCNQHALRVVQRKDPSEALGYRPGELLGCTHASESDGGCGTTEICSFCGAVQAILESQRGTPSLRECRVSRADGEAMDLLVRTTPLELHGQTFTIVSLTDISDQKRRRALERTFFHDVMNTGIGLQSLSMLIDDADEQTLRSLGPRLHQGVAWLLEQVAAQRDLMAAENGELGLRPRTASARELVREAIEQSAYVAQTRNVNVLLDGGCEDVALTTDPVQVSRVLGNMIKNAVEACDRGETVTVSCHSADGGVEFRVHNPAVMPRDVQLQLFQRSFSTKGPGRGLGTYSMKLLAERYLGGRVDFRSSKGEGTVFRVWLPTTKAAGSGSPAKPAS